MALVPNSFFVTTSKALVTPSLHIDSLWQSRRSHMTMEWHPAFKTFGWQVGELALSFLAPFVAMPFVPSFLLLVRPGATSSILAPGTDALPSFLVKLS